MGGPPHPFIASGFAPEYRYAEMKRRGVELLDGDQDIVPWLEVLLAPGHTPGWQSIAVDTEQG